MVADEMLLLVSHMRSAAEALLESLTPGQRRAACAEFSTPDHREWTYLPGERPGLMLGDLTAEQQDLALHLLATSFSPRGYSDLQMVMRVEEVRRELSRQQSGQDGVPPHQRRYYWLRILGRPGRDEVWGWRVNGHHLAAHATVVGSTVAGTPQFFGAEPARVQHGPHAGLQALPREEHLARELVLSLQPDQRATAVVAATAPDDILSRYDPLVAGPRPAGLSLARMDSRQAGFLEALLRQYLDRAAAPIANRAWSALIDAGLGHVQFSWAGPTEAGHGHYYAVSGPTFLLEYDNTQDHANHVHSVWRDRDRDWGLDLLAQHYGHAHG